VAVVLLVVLLADIMIIKVTTFPWGATDPAALDVAEVTVAGEVVTAAAVGGVVLDHSEAVAEAEIVIEVVGDEETKESEITTTMATKKTSLRKDVGVETEEEGEVMVPEADEETLTHPLNTAATK